ncbi:MAG: DNA gyrase subunit A [Rhodospirillales bacterium]|nr:DNA gyrase subunit A [Rhodospirillales bacterium]
MPLTTPPITTPEYDITPVTVEDEMKRSYLDYAMSVIVSRALPDVRDGLKPVHRRIIYSMNESGYDYNKPFRKSARIVGDVMGKYHPHGDSAIYDAMVRMAQDFSMRVPLINGQGNFGSMDGDRAAAMRYTEARMARTAHALIDDIDRDTVDFQPNYDESVSEPKVLPARFPNLLANGAGGIAVGMATNIPPHNLGELIDACFAIMDNPEVSIDELIDTCIPAPDFPTGGIILGRNGIRSAFHTGRGSVVMRGKTEIQEIRKGRFAIIITEVPYQVNKARMVEIFAETVRDKRIEGISDLRDESDRHGVRVVVELKRDSVPEVVLNQLFRYTPLQTSFGVNMLALNGGKPEMLNLKQILEAFLVFREEVIRRRTIFELSKARDKAHLFAGLAVAVANIDQVIALIRAASDPATARAQLMEHPWPASEVEALIELIDEPGRKVVDGVYQLSEAQAKAILELRLHRLTGLERDKIADDLAELGKQIEEHLSVLRSREKLLGVLRDELLEIKDRFDTPRRTALEDNEFEQDIEDLIQREDMVLTVTNSGYIKRVPVSAYRAQKRGGKGRSGMATRDEDFVSRVFVVNTHTPVLFFSSTGMVYKLKVYRLPLGSPQARGKAMINLLPLDQGEIITTMLPLPEDESTWENLFIALATASGNIRRNRLSDFTNVFANGKIAMKLKEGDKLVRVRTFTEDHDVLLSTRLGKTIRFPISDARVFSSRASTGVRGIRLDEGDAVIGMSALMHVEVDIEQRDDYLHAVHARNRLSSGDYTDRDEDLARDQASAARMDDPVFAEMAEKEEFIVTVSNDGMGKRTSAYEYRISGRGGKGVNSMDLQRDGDSATVVNSFPVVQTDQLVLVADSGQIIRVPVEDIRVIGRASRGVTVFNVSDDDRVVSVTRLRDEDDEGDEDEDGEDENGEEIEGEVATDEIASEGDAQP